MTSSSAWLESLGKEALSGTDISKSNYIEFETEDLVKAVNDNMDSVTKGIEAEATAAANWYNKWHANKNSQIGQLAELTKTGGKVARGAINFVKNAREFNEFMKTLSTGKEGEDKDLINEDKRQEDIKNIKGESLKVVKDLENEGATQEEINSAWDAGGVIRDNFDTKKEARLLMKEYYPGWRDMLHEQEFTLADGTKASLKSASSKEEYDEIDAIINQLFVNKVKEMGYSKGFMKKYIYKPMFQESKLNAKEWRTAFDKANLTSQKELRINDKVSAIVDEKDYSSFLTNIEDKVNSEGGRISYQTARREETAVLLEAVNARKINSDQIENLGNYKFKDHNGKEVTFREYWGPEYTTLYNAAIKLETDDASAKATKIEIAKTNLETGTIKAWQAKGEPITLDELKKAEDAWNSEPGYGPLPQSYVSLRTQLEKNEGEDVMVEKIKHKLRQQPPIPLTYADTRLLSAENQKIYNPFIGQGSMFGKAAVAFNKVILTEVSSGIDNNSEILGVTSQDRNSLIYINAKEKISTAYSDAYTAELLKESDDPPEVRIENAIRAGTTAAKNESAAIFKDAASMNALNTVGEKTDAMVAKEQLVSLYQNGINKGTIDLNQPTPFQGEDGALELGVQYAEQIAKGESPKVPAIWRQIAKGREDVDGHDLIMARLEATGKLPEGFTPTYNGPIFSNQAYALLHEKNTGSRTYRVLTGEGANIAEAFHAMSKNRDKGGYDAVFNSNGEPIETAKPISQMTGTELLEFLNENKNATIGMYGIPTEDFKAAVTLMGKTEGWIEGDASEILMDQDFQDRVILTVLRQKNESASKTNNIDTSWMKALVLDPKDVKELNDILPFFKDYPMMQLENMLPDVAKAVVQAASTN